MLLPQTKKRVIKMTHIPNQGRKKTKNQDKFQIVFVNTRQVTVCSYESQVLSFTPGSGLQERLKLLRQSGSVQGHRLDEQEAITTTGSSLHTFVCMVIQI